MNRHGKDLDDDVEYQRRLAAGEIEPPAPAGDIALLPYAKRSVAIFLAAVAAICIFGVFEGLRPTVDVGGRRGRADVGHAADPDVHAQRRGR